LDLNWIWIYAKYYADIPIAAWDPPVFWTNTSGGDFGQLAASDLVSHHKGISPGSKGFAERQG
jgi:hypothetical protein